MEEKITTGAMTIQTRVVTQTGKVLPDDRRSVTDVAPDGFATLRKYLEDVSCPDSLQIGTADDGDDHDHSSMDDHKRLATELDGLG